MQALEQGNTFKYLGTEESEFIQKKKRQKIEKGIYQEIKNDAEVWVECQE